MTSLAALCVLGVLGIGAAAATRFAESRITVPGELLAYECPDIDQDGRGDLVLVVKEDGGRALLAWFETATGGFPDAPDRRWQLPPDVIAYRFFALSDAADARGLELLLFTRSGVFAAKTSSLGLKGNLSKVLDVPVFPDVPAPDAVPRWPWVKDVDGDGAEELLVPRAGGISVFAVEKDEARVAAGAPRLVLRDTFALLRHDESTDDETEDAREADDADNPERAPRTDRSRGGRDRTRAGRGPRGLFAGAPPTLPTFTSPPVLKRSDEFDTPALRDWDGDGKLDAIRETYRRFEVTSFGAHEPLLRTRLPTSSGKRADLKLLGNGKDARVLTIEEIGDGLEKDHVATIFGRTAEGGLATEPLARVKIQAAGAQFEVDDVDGDGKDDLIAKALILPSALQAVTDVFVEGRLFVFRGQPDGSISKKPDLRFERRLRPENMARIRETMVFDLTGDYDGDGMKDLVLIRSDGVLQIFPMRRAGDGLEFASDPSTSVRPERLVRAATAAVLSADRVSDLVLRHEDGLTVFVSVPSGEESK